MFLKRPRTSCASNQSTQSNDAESYGMIASLVEQGLCNIIGFPQRRVEPCTKCLLNRCSGPADGLEADLRVGYRSYLTTMLFPP